MLAADVNLVTSVLSRNLAAMRAQRGLTYDRLAEMSGVSKGMLVQIEHGSTNPSIGTLCRIATALHIGLPRLLGAPPRPRVEIVRSSCAASVLAARLVVGRESPEALEFRLWRLGSRESLDGGATPISPRGATLVLEGTLTVSLEDERHLLEEGDVLSYEGGDGLCFRNETVYPVRFATVALEPLQDSN